MNRFKLFTVIGLFLLLSFYGFSRYVKNGGLKNADFAVTVKIQERIDMSSRLRLASFVGNVMEGSKFFAGPVFSSVIVVLLTITALYDTKKKKIRFAAIAIPILFAALVAGEVYGKTVVHHPAPPFFMIKNPTTVFPKYYINDSYSYPSGHAARAVFISMVLFTLLSAGSLLSKSKARMAVLATVLLGYIGLVSLSAIYLGHHWLSDIIGGGLLGSGFGLLTLAFISPIIDKQ